jgi:hypothetical protein
MKSKRLRHSNKKRVRERERENIKGGKEIKKCEKRTFFGC